ncbi:MAG TPA: LiaF domain-containing protein [Polyangiaceae bacterium]
MQTAELEHGYREEDELALEGSPVATVADSFERGAALGGLRILVRSEQFRSGRVTAVLSGITVDLREAALSPEGATIHVQSALSGIDIFVPPDWDVDCDVDAIGAGVGEDRCSAQPRRGGPRLRVIGTVVAGSLSVR